jgi:hypothetical protein
MLSQRVASSAGIASLPGDEAMRAAADRPDRQPQACRARSCARRWCAAARARDARRRMRCALFAGQKHVAGPESARALAERARREPVAAGLDLALGEPADARARDASRVARVYERRARSRCACAHRRSGRMLLHASLALCRRRSRAHARCQPGEFAHQRLRHADARFEPRALDDARGRGSRPAARVLHRRSRCSDAPREGRPYQRSTSSSCCWARRRRVLGGELRGPGVPRDACSAGGLAAHRERRGSRRRRPLRRPLRRRSPCRRLEL